MLSKKGHPIEGCPFLHQFVIFSTSRSTIVLLRVEENAVLHHSRPLQWWCRCSYDCPFRCKGQVMSYDCPYGQVMSFFLVGKHIITFGGSQIHSSKLITEKGRVNYKKTANSKIELTVDKILLDVYNKGVRYQPIDG